MTSATAWPTPRWRPPPSASIPAIAISDGLAEHAGPAQDQDPHQPRTSARAQATYSARPSEMAIVGSKPRAEAANEVSARLSRTSPGLSGPYRTSGCSVINFASRPTRVVDTDPRAAPQVEGSGHALRVTCLQVRLHDVVHVDGRDCARVCSPSPKIVTPSFLSIWKTKMGIALPY